MSMIQEQLKRNLVPLMVAYIPCLALFTVLALQNHIPLSYLTRDPAEIMDANSYIGFVSNLGVLMWSGAAAISLFTALVLYQAPHSSNVPLYFLVSAGITLLFLFDDLLMLHERFGPNQLHLPQPLIMAMYAGMFLLYLTVFRATILKMDSVFLLFCFGFLGLSAISDTLSDVVPELKNYVLEDGAKFFAIVSWLAHITLGALAHVQQTIGNQLIRPPNKAATLMNRRLFKSVSS
jgi:hypothetical protein